MAAERGQDASKVGIEVVEAFNAGDWHRLRAALTPEVVYQETGTQRRTEGPDEYVQLSQGWKQTFPDARGTVRNALASGNSAALEITWEGTHRGPLPLPDGVLAATGRSIVVQATMWFTVEGARVREIRHHLDLTALLQQIGAAPASAHAGG